ncbi:MULTISPECIES: hypothetical protein, partial [unclassified Gilliamella]
ARNQYTRIESYKDILKSENQIQDGSECILFAFFEPDAKYDQQLKKRAEQKAKEYLTKLPYSGNAMKDELDDIFVTYIVGDKEFAKEQNFTITYPAYGNILLNDVARFFYFRFVSEVSLSCAYFEDTPPLGDYVRVELTENQKAQILTIFKNSQEAQNVLTDNLDVVAVKFPNAKEKVAEWKRNQVWQDKHGKRVNDDSL